MKLKDRTSKQNIIIILIILLICGVMIFYQTKKEGIHEGIKGSVLLLRSLGHDNDVIRTAIISQYHLSDEEADQYL